MKSVPDSGPIWSAWANGKALVGPNKPHSRITVQPSWWLNTTNVAGARPAAKLPIRYFQTLANDQQEIEIPGVRSIDVDYDVDQDVATLSVQLVNNRFDPDYGSSEWQNSNGDFGRPGYLTSDRGSASNRWGYVPNEWSGLLVRNALIRSYEGYGGQEKTLEQALADGNLVLTGIWLVDDVPIKTGQGFELQARNTGKLLVDQYLYPPLVPAGDYPMSRARFFYSSTSITTAQVIYGTNGLPNSKFRILRIERSLAGGYWLVGTDGGVFTYGPAHFQGSIDSIGLTITPGVYPSEGVTGISRSHTGDGYWLVTDTGNVYSFGDAAYHGGAGLSDPPTHPVIAIETAGTRDGYFLIGDDGGVFCQPPGTFVTRSHHKPKPGRGHTGEQHSYEDVPIESLQVGDYVVSYGQTSHDLRRGGSRIEGVTRRRYKGDLITIKTDEGHVSRYTADHSCIAVLGDALKDKVVLYLMRRGDQYRVGVANAMRSYAKNPRHNTNNPKYKPGDRQSSFGVVGRCHEEGGDAFWILSLHDDRREALIAEGLMSVRHGIPSWTFPASWSRRLSHQKNGNKRPEADAEFFWREIGENTEAAVRCLEAVGQSIRTPFWQSGVDGRSWTVHPRVVPACNLLSGMRVLLAEKARNSGSNLRCYESDAVPVSVFRTPYDGEVISLHVEGDHTYVADGIITHNCFGDVDFYGSLPPLVAGAKIVDGASTPDGLGYWLVDNFGHVYSFGPSANYFGGITGALSAPIVAIASSPTGNGYVMTGKDGGVFVFGDARFYGSVPGLSPPIVLNDPVCDIVVTESGNGYWLAAEDGGVFAFGDAVFYGSLPQPDTITTTTTTDGNYLDISDIAKDIFLYAGFNLYDGGATDDVYGVVETTGIYVPDEGGNVLDATFFDKLPCQDPLTKLKEIVGYVMYVGDEGEIHWHEANFWESGNFLPDHSHTATVPVIDERVQLTSYQVNTPDKDLRSEIIISSEDPDLGIAGTVTTSFTPSTARELRGLVRPAMWVNQAFVDSATQQTMAELIALHIYFKSRLGTVACMGNPMIQIDDQVQILERETFETNTHYVRRIHRTHDRKAGTYSMQLTTNVLSPPGSWAVVKPTGTPEGSIVVRRP